LNTDAASKALSHRIASAKTKVTFGFLFWLGGAMHVYNQPSYGFWDALIWLYYVGRYVAMHFAATPAMAVFGN